MIHVNESSVFFITKGMCTPQKKRNKNCVTRFYFWGRSKEFDPKSINILSNKNKEFNNIKVRYSFQKYQQNIFYIETTRFELISHVSAGSTKSFNKTSKKTCYAESHSVKYITTLSFCRGILSLLYFGNNSFNNFIL